MRLHSTRNPAWQCNLRQAVSHNLAPDGGLLVPELPRWHDWPELLAMPWPERGAEIVVRLADGDLPEQALRQVAREALDIAAPLVALPDGTFVLELWHGPTCAFKDFGARLLAAMLALVDGPDAPPRTILTATSGDTGAAVAAAFHGATSARAVVLYPAGRVSPLQERQIAGLGGNVLALCVAGSFDDCQALVKQAFADESLAQQLRLTSANSIHIARILAQITYFSQIVAELAKRGRPDVAPVVAVPSGNFGHLCAALYAKQLGLTLGPLVVATNANATVPDYLDSGQYLPRPSLATLSNAMDVGAPSNWERIVHLFAGDWQAMRAGLRWATCSDEQTRQELVRLHNLGYLADPHGAVAAHALRGQLRPDETGVFVATAHPAKFAEVVAPLFGQAVALPPALQRLAKAPLQREVLANDGRALRDRLTKWGPGGPIQTDSSR